MVALSCLLTPEVHPTRAQTLSSHGDWRLRQALQVVCPDVPPLCVVYCPACLCLSGYVLFPGPPGGWLRLRHRGLLYSSRCGQLGVARSAAPREVAARCLELANHVGDTSTSFRSQNPETGVSPPTGSQ